MALSLTSTLEQAKEFLRSHWGREGITCPCCNQRVQMYRRSITSAMACALILLSRRETKHGEWIHIEKFLKDIDKLPASICGDVPKLRFWGLIERKQGERDDGSTRIGCYRLTDKGRDFVNGKITCQKYAKIYNNTLFGFEGENYFIYDCLKNKFNYNELMGRQHER